MESRNDDLKLGRYKVRVVGIHTEDKSVLPTNDLPWATCLQPTTSAAMSGIGLNPGLVNGSWVMVVFTSEDYQVPIIIGSVAGIPGKPGQEVNSDAITVSPPAIATPTEKQIGVEEGVYDASVFEVGSPYLGTLTQTQYNQFTAKVRQIESGNKYSIVNTIGYLGAYQFGAMALETLGYIKKGSWATYKKNSTILDNADNWTGKDGCINKDFFLKSISVQDNCMLLLSQKNYKLMYLKNQVGDRTDPRVLAGFLGAAHNQGAGAVSKLIRGETTKDGYGTTAQSYYDKCYSAIVVQADQPTNTTPATNTSSPQPIPAEENLSPPITNNNVQPLGFSDPEGKYPSYTDEPDTNRLVRGQNIVNTIVNIKEKERVKNVSIGLSAKSWDQPSIQYAAQYPYNHAQVSESGHVFELDDSPNAERVHLYHRSGTFTEIDQAGNQVNKIVGHGIEIIERDGYINIKGNGHITVDGEFTLQATNGFVEMKNLTIKTDNLRVDTKTFDLKASESVKIESPKVSISASDTLTAIGSTKATLSSSGETNIKCGGEVNVDGSKINLNSNKGSFTAPVPIAAITEFTGEIMNITGVSRSESDYCKLDEHPHAAVINADENAEVPPMTNTPVPAVTPTTATPTFTDECPIFDLTKGDSLQLTPNYRLKDLCKDGNFNFSGQHGLTAQNILCNLYQLSMNVIEPLRQIYGSSLKINSCIRPSGSPVSQTNGVSQHELGQAVDIGFLDIPHDANRKAKYFERAKSILGQIPYDKFLFETRGATSVWLHISYRKGALRKEIYTFVNDRKKADKLVLFT